jgi:hypothetical protein
LLDHLKNSLDATHPEFSLTSMDGVADSADVGSGLVGTRQKLKQRWWCAARAIRIADAMPATLAAQMLAQQLTAAGIKQTHVHRVPLHLHVASYPAGRSSVVGRFRFYVLEPGSASQNLKPKPRLALRERDKAFFAKYVQGLQLDKLLALDPEQLENESQKNIYFNAKLFVDRLRESFGDDQVALIAFGSFLVLRCFLVSVSTPSQHSAFRVFSVMNIHRFSAGSAMLSGDCSFGSESVA